MLSAVLAVFAAVANALATVLQRKAARDQPAGENLSWRLIWHLLHRPIWFAGVLAVITSFLLQATALGNGRISVVEPILVLELPATLVLSSFVFGSRLGGREWGTSAMMTAGLAALLFALAPSGGSPTTVTWQEWTVGVGANLLLIGAGVVWGRSTSQAGASRAAVLGATTGCTFGLTAALMKGMTSVFERGFVAVLTSWQLYAMIAAGIGAMFLLQSAVHAGRLLAVQPGLTLADPVVSVLWGVLVFDEHVRTGLFLVPALLGMAAVVAAVPILARSPLLSGEAGESEADGAGRP